MKKRLDIILSEREHFPSREKARAAVMAGMVFVEGRMCDKAGTAFDDAVAVEIKGHTCPYVSRGGLKLEKALKDFNIDLHLAVCLDIGASTGGFSDCMLQNGASKVYAVDVGYGQLDWKLRTDPRVVTMERVNFRYLDPMTIVDRFDFVSADVSFISLKLIFPVAKSLMKKTGLLVCLVKPQFEAGREFVGKKGIVKNPDIHKSVLHAVSGYALSNGFAVKDFSFSPIKGAKGNIEYLMCLTAENENASQDLDCLIDRVVSEAHTNLDS